MAMLEPETKLEFTITPPKWMAAKANKPGVKGDIKLTVGPGFLAAFGVVGLYLLLKALGVAVDDDAIALGGLADIALGKERETAGGPVSDWAFYNKWRQKNHDQRMTYRRTHSKADDWMPEGYPSFWD